MGTPVSLLFDEFALRYRRGERPDVREYLERAGAEREDLGLLIDRFLQAVPAREPSEEEVVLLQAQIQQEPPLLLLRKRRKLRREAVIAALMTALQLDPAKREKVAGYYHELETGLLDPERVDRTVWAALGEFLRANVRALARAGTVSPAAPAASYLRAADFALETHLENIPDQPARAEEPDNVDRLFTGGA
jgi:hypothetical protein